MCKWDSVIPLEPMWKEIDRLLKPDGVFVTTAAQPFTSFLVVSKIEWFKYDLVWNKCVVSGHLNSHKMPLRQHEDICIFSKSKNGNYTYNQIVEHTGIFRKVGSLKTYIGKERSRSYGSRKNIEVLYDIHFPKSILTFSRGKTKIEESHPTQKPIGLYDYLVKTYSNENDTVLDFCFGSGTTAMACMMNNRNFIGIEKNEKYFDMAQKRIEDFNIKNGLFSKEL